MFVVYKAKAQIFLQNIAEVLEGAGKCKITMGKATTEGTRSPEGTESPRSELSPW